jgi:tRNA dimethylallyltransferase
VVVGGTNYYIQSLLWNDHVIGNPNEPVEAHQEDNSLRLEIQKLLEGKDESGFHEALKKVDLTMANRWHPNERRRIRRSLEIYASFGIPHSEILKAQTKNPRYNCLVLWVHTDTEMLHKRLDDRIETMLKRGMMSELEQWKDATIGDICKTDFSKGAFQAIGIREFVPYLHQRNDHCYKKGITEMQQNTRIYARKQVMWIKNKLGPLCEDALPDIILQAVDSSNISEWDNVVETAAEDLTRRFLRGNDINEEYNHYCPTAPALREERYSLEDWDQFHCEICEQTVHGKREQEIHMKSSRHRKNVAVRNSPNWEFIKNYREKKRQSKLDSLATHK